MSDWASVWCVMVAMCMFWVCYEQKVRELHCLVAEAEATELPQVALGCHWARSLQYMDKEMQPKTLSGLKTTDLNQI